VRISKQTLAGVQSYAKRMKIQRADALRLAIEKGLESLLAIEKGLESFIKRR
jgi:hypothetical protein